MLGQMTPEQFNERLAHYAIDPWGDGWAVGSTIAKEVKALSQTYVTSKTGKMTPVSEQPKVRDYIPLPAWLRARYDNEDARERIRRSTSNGNNRNYRR